jgi:hypothetical protein
VWAPGYEKIPFDSGTLTSYGYSGQPSLAFELTSKNSLELSGHVTNQYGDLYPDATVQLFAGDSALTVSYDVATDGTFGFAVDAAGDYGIVVTAGTLTETYDFTVDPSRNDLVLVLDDPSAVAPTVPVELPVLSAATVGVAVPVPTSTWADESWQPAATTWAIDGSPVGSDGQDFTPTADDFGKALTASVHGVRTLFGHEYTVSFTTEPVTVAVGTLVAPGIEVVYNEDGLYYYVAANGDSAPYTYPTYQWYRDDVALSEWTDSYKYREAADYGTTLSVTVTYALDGYTPAVATLTADTLALRPAREPGAVMVTPSDDGLFAVTWGWPGDVAVQWYRNGAAILGATTGYLEVPLSERGYSYFARVTSADVGYEPVSVDSDTIDVRPYPLEAEIEPTAPASTAEVGDTLTADPGYFGEDVTVVGQWYDENVALADGPSHLVVAAEGGHTLTYKVTASKTGYLAEYSFTTAVSYIGDLVPAVPTISGSTALGGVLEVSAGDWGSDEVVTSVRWYRDPNGEPIHIGTSYTVTEDDLDRVLTVRVTGSRDGYSCLACGGDTATADVTIPAAPFASTATPVIDASSAYDVGDALTVSSADWEPAASVEYEWFRDGESIDSGSSHTLVVSDFGAVLTVEATGSRAGFVTETVPSAELLMPFRPFAGVSLSVVGGTAIGDVLTAVGDDLSPDATYTWRRGSVVVGTDAGYTVTSADATSTLSVTYSVPAHDGYDAYVTSAASTTIDALVLTPGTAAYTLVGNTLTGTTTGWASGVATTFEWEDLLGLHSGSSYTLTAANYDTTLTLHVTGTLALHDSASTTVEYKVPKGTLTQDAVTITGSPTPGSTLTGHAGAANVSGSTADGEWHVNGLYAGSGNTYVVKAADRGATITYTSTLSLARYTTAVSEVSTVIPLGTIAPGTVTVTGGTSLGSVLTAATGTWPSGVTLATRWLRNGVAIAGAAGLAYTVSAADQGALVTFEVAASGQYLAGTTVSVSASIPAAIVPPTPPVIVDRVVETFVDRPVPVETIVTRDVERVVEKQVVVEKVVTVTETLLEFTAVPDPVIKGKAVVGSTLTVKSAAWKPGAVTLTYQWFAGSRPIKGATSKTLKVAASAVGKKITVKVTGSRDGYAKESTRSEPTAKVKAKKK